VLSWLIENNNFKFYWNWYDGIFIVTSKFTL
jgi:hypothetical protein